MLKQVIDKRNYIILFIIILLILFIIFGHNKIKEYMKTFYYFSETITIKIYTDKNTDKIFNDIDRIYEKYSDYYKNSSNNDDKELIKILKYGKSLYNETNGLIDITSNELLDNILEDKDFKFKTTIDKLDFKRKETLNNINIDSIIGAYATAKIEKYLLDNNITQYIINEDGNIITGKGINNERYKISIMSKENKVLDIACLERVSMATKGNTNTFKSYMVNPVTSGKDKENKLVVVIDKDINTANMLANTLYLMSVKDGEEFIKKYDAEALWYDGDAKQMTSGFKSYLENKKKL